MISRRLTKTQKNEILESYRSGEDANDLAKKYDCSVNTVNRTVRTLLSEDEYSLLKKQRLKANKHKNQSSDSKDLNLNKDFSDLENQEVKILPTIENDMDKKMIGIEEFDSNEDPYLSKLALEDASDFDNNLFQENQNNDAKNLENTNEEQVNNFEEIVPLISAFDFENQKTKLELQKLSNESLPEVVYMLVDKKVELEPQSISDLPEWDFLPEDELIRGAIVLFSNQRSAKRNCSRNQRVIKIPNTNIFRISKSYLVSKGITRLIHDDSLIALDE